MKKKIFFIAISVLIMIFGISYMAINHYLASQKSFEKAGYILSSKDNSSSNKSTAYYFSDNTKYKNRFDDTVTFNDVNGDKVNVDESSFIHYNDESIGVLKKAVIFNLEQIDSEIPIYYNIFENTILKYNSNRTYSVDNLGKRLIFQNFIVKVSDNKFLIIGDKMQVDLDKTSTVTMNSNFIELTFVDDKVVTIEDKDSKYQTISKDAIIHLNDEVTLNLDNRYLYKEKEAKLSIDQMVIDSSDNIEIQPIEEGNGEEEEGVEGSEGGNGGSGSDIDGVAGDGTAIDGTVDDGTTGGDSYVETEVQEAALALPNAEITDSSITPFTFSADVHITDKDNLMYGSIYASIIENSTGRSLYYEEFPEGSFDLAISAENLSPETTYNLQVTLSYRKNNVEYTMDAIQYVFITSSIGVSLEKDYYTTDSLNFNLVFDSYSKVKTCWVALYNSVGDLVGSANLYSNSGQSIPIPFEGLDPNTKYTAKVYSITYEDGTSPDSDLSVEISARTLKQRPVIDGKPQFIVDKRAGKFTLTLSTVKDPHNGVVNYRYEIYDAYDYQQPNSTHEPVMTIDKENLGSIDIDVLSNEQKGALLRGRTYFYRVVIEFYDNEKYVEYTTPDSDFMTLGGVEGPKMVWHEKSVTFERIVGNIEIQDPNGTIDTTKPFTVIYRNSIGTEESFQAIVELNAGIAFDRNNLRAQETYTIEVIASVNLGEGNGNVAYESYSVLGSIIINTPAPNDLVAEMKEVEHNSLAAFSADVSLVNDVTNDNSLEASTLTGLTFNLYSGAGVNETNKIRSISLVDSDMDEYTSDLKERFYNKVVSIEPEFFGLQNSDIKDYNYTIEITNAYDYTDFKNKIGIKNNIITVHAVSGLPGDPTSGDNAVDIHLIKNKDVQRDTAEPRRYPTLQYDDQLELETVVGFTATAKFDNSQHLARTFTYHVYDADQCETKGKKTVCKEIASYEYTVPENGNVDEVVFEVGYGTELDTVDTELRRGHHYYVTYEAMLDTNNDGVGDIPYPSADSDVELRSGNISVPKEDVTLDMYPSSSRNREMTINYIFKDIDHVLDDGKLHSGVGTLAGSGFVHRGAFPLVAGRDEDGNLRKLTITDLDPGYIRLYTNEHLFKNVTLPYEHEHIKQKFSNEFTPEGLSYSISSSQTNALLIQFKDYDTNPAYKNITSVNIKFTAGGKSIEKNRIPLNQALLLVDLFDISEFRGQKVDLSISANYDSEIFGFDLDYTNFAAQTIINDAGGGNYFTINVAGNLTANSTNANGSDFTVTRDPSKITLNSNITNKKADIPFEYDEGGMVYNYSHYILKALKTKEVTAFTDADRSFTFSVLVPGISTTDVEGNSRIIPLITSTDVGGKISGFEGQNASEIKDDEVTIKLYKEPVPGKESEDNVRQFLRDIKVTVDELEAGTSIDNLDPNTAYSIEFYADVSDSNGGYVTERLYDIDQNADNVIYYFKTLAGVEIDDINYYFSARSYNDKTLYFSYTMDRTTGFQFVRYYLYEKVCDDDDGQCHYEPMDIELEDDHVLKNNMTLEVSVNPGETDFKFDNSTQYKLEIIPYAVANVADSQKEIPLEGGSKDDIVLSYLASPVASIRATLQSLPDVPTGSITFTTTIYDRNRTIVDDKYTVQLLNEDGSDITPEEWSGKEFKTTDINSPFVVPNLAYNKTYTLVVKFRADTENNITSAKDMEFKKSVTLYSSDKIFLGEVTAVMDTNYANRVALRFIDSYQLDLIDTIIYSIYDSSTGETIDGEAGFNPRKDVVADGTVYTFSIPATLPAAGSYFVQAQFIKNGIKIDEINVPYVYVS